MILQIITTLTSAYSTFNVLIDRLYIKKNQGELNTQKLPENRKYLQATGKPPTVTYMLAFALKLIFQITFQTMFLFMILWMTLFHERWENFRYYMTRNYFPKSAAFMSGFLILFAYFLTTSGKGFE